MIKNGLRSLCLLTSALLVVAFAQEPPATPEKKGEARPDATVKQPLRMDEPMQTGMMKDGMMKGDVQDAAKSKDAKMEEMIKNEEKSMPPAPPAK